MLFLRYREKKSGTHSYYLYLYYSYYLQVFADWFILFSWLSRGAPVSSPEISIRPVFTWMLTRDSWWGRIRVVLSARLPSTPSWLSFTRLAAGFFLSLPTRFEYYSAPYRQQLAQHKTFSLFCSRFQRTKICRYIEFYPSDRGFLRGSKGRQLKGFCLLRERSVVPPVLITRLDNKDPPPLALPACWQKRSN